MARRGAAERAEAQRLHDAVVALAKAEAPIRVLRGLAWPREVRAKFFARKATRLPKVVYEPVDPGHTLEGVRHVRTLAENIGVARDWLLRHVEAVEASAWMMACPGTRAFFHHARDLYGVPTDTLADQESTSLALAKTLDEALSGLTRGDLGPPPPTQRAADVRRRMKKAVTAHFGDQAPRIEIAEHLSANAIAGPERIRLRKGARFTENDVGQLIHHEAFIHVATSLNGRMQRALPILAASHPGNTRTQEGLAVFAEYISGQTAPRRLRRLTDRVLTIQMSIDGADFMEVYRYLLDRLGDPEQAFEDSRRVFRGGVLTGGAPFTKDGVYLDGWLRVHNFLRAVLLNGRWDCMRLLFCGKLDIEDVPALCHLSELGLLEPPRFLPPWVEDSRFLVSHLAYSGFLDQVKLDRVRDHYEDLLRHAPVVELNGAA